MKRTVTAVVLASAIASSAALAAPHWTADSKGAHPLFGIVPRDAHVDRDRAAGHDRNDNGGQTNGRGAGNRNGDNRGDGRRMGEPQEQWHSVPDSKWKRDLGPVFNGNRNGRPSFDRPGVAGRRDNDRGGTYGNNDGRGERRYARDPRPYTQWDRDQRNWNNDRHDDRRDNRERGPGHNWDHDRGDDHDRDGRNWDRDRRWDHNHWRDDHGHDWRHERGWYDRYRLKHFRYYGGRYYGRTRYDYGHYYAPYGYRSRVWIVGDWLPSDYFYGGQYYIDDYWRFDLYEPPYGCRWIRVGGDALLADLLTREIVDAIYNLYW